MFTMKRAILLLLVLSWISIVQGGNKTCGVGSLLSDSDIALVQDSWAIAKDIPTIQTRTLLEHFKAHPKTQALFPKFANVPLSELPNNAAFLKQARSCVSFGLNFIVANLNNPSLLKDMLGRVDAYGKWYVDYMTKERQMKETVKIFMQVLTEEMGGQLSSEARTAWKRVMTLSFVELMGNIPMASSSGESVLTDFDIALVRRSYAIISENSNIPPKTFIKHFELHPATQKLFPKFADVPVSDLMSNTEFLTQAHTCLKGLFFIVNNLDNDELLTRALSKMTKPGYFVSYQDPIHQLDETTRLFLEAVEEEMPIDSATKAAWKKALDHVMAIMARNAPFSTEVARVLPSPLTGKQKGLIRDSWALARRNAEIAPKIMLRHFELHPESQAMFPRLACIARSELINNKYFLQAAYNCFFGITFMVKNLDNMDIIDSLIVKFASPSYYVADLTSKQQLDDITRIILQVMKEELGSDIFTTETTNAWKVLLDHVHKALSTENKITSLTADDLNLVGDTWGIAKRNKKFGANVILKFLKTFPNMQTFFLKFPDTPLSTLPRNPEFLAHTNMLMAGMDFLIDNIDDPRILKMALKGKGLTSFFLPGVSILHQLDETNRIFLEALDEELADRMTPRTKQTWVRALAHLSKSMADNID